MDEVVVKKLNEITQWIEATLTNSKYIHELDLDNNEDDLYIAVSNGVETKKILYKPNEVTREEFQNLYKMQLGSDSSSNSIYIEDSEGNMLTILSLDFLVKDTVKYTSQFRTAEEQKQARGNIDAVGNPEMEAIVFPDWSGMLDINTNF